MWANPIMARNEERCPLNPKVLLPVSESLDSETTKILAQTNEKIKVLSARFYCQDKRTFYDYVRDLLQKEVKTGSPKVNKVKDDYLVGHLLILKAI